MNKLVGYLVLGFRCWGTWESARHWLANFTFYIDLHWAYFLLPGLLVLLIAWATVSLQTFRAAIVNPVECLKEE